VTCCCDKCRSVILKETEHLTAPSELFIHEKNYWIESDFGKLKAPSDLFFNICKTHIKTFENIFKNNKTQMCIKNLLLSNALSAQMKLVLSHYGFMKIMNVMHIEQIF